MEEGKGLGSLIPKASFRQVVNHPLTYAFLIITLTGLSFFYLYTQQVKERLKGYDVQIENCEQEVETANKRGDEFQKQRDELYNKLLFKQGYSDSVRNK